MAQIWLELKYGVKGHGIALCRLDTPYLLQAYKKCALARARHLAEESRGIDEVIHFQDQTELERLQKLFNLVIPEENGEVNSE